MKNLINCMVRSMAFAQAIAFLLLLTPAAGAQTAESRGKPRDIPISFLTGDSLELHAWLTVTDGRGEAPLLITLPMRGHTHSTYEPFIEKVFEYFVADTTGRPRPYILNIDMRGHGESRSLGGNAIDYSDMSNDQYRRMPFDIAELANSLIADSRYSISTKGVMIVGASIGANVSIMAAELIPGTYRVVMLSPGINYHGLSPDSAIKDCKSEVLILAGKQDGYSFKSSMRLAKAGCDKVTFKPLDSGYHGTTIIIESEREMRKLIEWLFRP